MERWSVLFLSVALAGPALASGEEGGPARLASLESAAAFDEVLAELASLRDMILADARDEREAAEGLRFLLRTVAMSQDVTGDGYPPAPHFARMDSERRKIGGDNPDAEYHNTVWASGLDYVVRGNRGSVDHLSFTVLERQPDGRQKKLGYLNERDLDADANGDFRFFIGPTRPKAPGPWIQTGAVDGTMLVRQYVGDRSEEALARYEIDVADRAPGAPLPPSTDAEIAAALRGTRLAMGGIARLHRYVSPGLGDPPNRFTRRNSDDFGADISSADNLYMISPFEIGADEALIVSVKPLDVRYWNFAIENPWHESVDYNVRRTSLTHDAVVADPDGLVRFLVAQAPADHPNHLETAGHARGFMTFRWVGERDTEAPLPEVTRLPLAEAVERASELGGRGAEE